MYEAFYSLNANPFRLTPDPRFCFSHTGYQRAREYLVYALKLGEGFIVITGQPGTGKTTLAETFLKELEVSKVVAERIVASNLGAMGLLRSVAFAFDLPTENIDRATLRRDIEQLFIQQVRGGRRVLLVIDEAQGLLHSALEELRLLADLQSGTQPLLQIFLVGQHSLQDLLQQPDMNQFQQRVIATCNLKPLALAETAAYMEYRLTQAGWKGDPEFTGEAVLSIYRYSLGVPRHINKLCNRLLLIGYGKEKHTIDQEDVEEISTEMRLEKLIPISGNKSGTTDEFEVPFEAELPDNRFSLDSLALRYEGSAIESLDMAVETEQETESEACSYSAETADWPVEVAAAAYLHEQGEHLQASSLPVADKEGTALYRWALSAKYGLEGIGRLLVKAVMLTAFVSLTALTHFIVVAKRSLATIGKLPIKPVLMATALVTAFISTAALTRFHETQPVAIEPVASAPETPAAMDDRQAAAIEPVASAPETPAAMDDRQAVTIEPVASAPEPPAVMDDRQAAAIEAVASAPEPPAVMDDRQAAAIEPAASVPEPPAVMDDRQAAAIEPAASVPEPPAVMDDRLAAAIEPAASVPETPAAMDDRQAAAIEPVASAPETPAVMDDRQMESLEQVASLQDTGVAVNEAVSLVTPAEKPVAVPPEPDESASVVAGTPRPVTALPSPSPAPVPESREARIARLLGRARQSLERDRLLVPAGDNASLYYNRVLALDPDNRAALDGIDRIAGRYAELASYASWRQDSGKARLYLERGLRVQPDNAELLVLRTTLDRPPASGGAEVVDRSIIASREPPKPFFSELKDLLDTLTGTAR